MYKTIGMPIALEVIIYPFTGVLLSLLIAASKMALSSLTVTLNANR